MQDARHGASEQGYDFDPIAERFFSQPPPPCEVAPGDGADDWHPEPLSSLERVAMLTTAAPAMALLAVAITLLVSEPLLAGSAKNAARESWHALPAPASSTPEPIAPQPPEASAAHGLPPEAPAMALEAVQPVAQPSPTRPQRAKVARSVPAARREKPSPAAKRARQLLDRGDAAGARDVAREAVRTAPERAAGYIVLAAALDELGDRAGKAAAFRSCAQLATDRLASACKTLARER